MIRKQASDLSGKRFHMLTVIDEHITEKAGRWWNCVCDCGGTRVALGSEMKRGGTKSCGCSRTKATDWTGHRFGMLTAIRLLSPKGTKHAKWESLCDCGNTHKASIDDMKAGKTTSCGCKLTSTRESSMLGKHFGKLEVTSSSHKVVNQWFYKCICHACGNTEHVVNGMSLRNGDARSCGCSHTGNDLTGVQQGSIQVLRKEGTKWLVACACGKTWLVNSFSISTGKLGSCGCKNMFPNGRSKFEDSVVAFVESLGVKTEHNRRDVMDNNLELDIFIPDHNLAIECNGVAWHSSRKTTLFKARTRHETKTQACRRKGIRLIHVRDDWWADKTKRPIVESIISHALGCTSKRIYGRLCVVRELQPREFIDFANDNHLKGAGRSNQKIGLFHDDVLVAAVSYMQTVKGTELVRFVVKMNHVVIGGLSKLLKHSGHDHVGTYLDTGMFNGSGYTASGFKLGSNGVVSMSFVKGSVVKGRQHFTKPAMRRSFGVIDETKTQVEIAAANGWHALFGCRQAHYTWTRQA